MPTSENPQIYTYQTLLLYRLKYSPVYAASRDLFSITGLSKSDLDRMIAQRRQISILIVQTLLNQKDTIAMDIEYNSKRSRPSILERSSSLHSSVMSLERFSLPRNLSLSHKTSLVSAMDLQLSKHSKYSDFFVESDPNRFSDMQRQSVVYQYKIDVEEKDLNRKSACKIAHECLCQGACLTVHCACFLTPREICVIGQCCSACIASKNDYLQTTRGFQLERQRRERQALEHQTNPLHALKQKNYKNLHYYKHAHANQPMIKDLIFCTCKKSHCQKKYCLCFDKGVKCGQFCICIECQNKDEEEQFREEQQRRWERYATYKPYDEKEEENAVIDGNIDQFLDQQQKQQEQWEFNRTMEFQPVNFDKFINNRYQ